VFHEVLSVVLSFLQSRDRKKVSLSSLLEASAKGKEGSVKELFFICICGGFRKYRIEASTVMVWQVG
jgi:hypothetical protein